MNDITDLRSTIVPKSDQTNSEDLLTGPRTIRVTSVKISDTKEQPVIVHYEGDNGRPYKPCLTMRKLLVFAWGADGREWAGRSMTLYNDPDVKFGGMEVGGIRISHLSDIDRDMKVSLTSTKGKKAMYSIKRMHVSAPPARPERTQKHLSMIADFELIAEEQGVEAFKASWEKLTKEDRAAIGVDELARIKGIAQKRDEKEQKE